MIAMRALLIATVALATLPTAAFAQEPPQQAANAIVSVPAPAPAPVIILVPYPVFVPVVPAHRAHWQVTPPPSPTQGIFTTTSATGIFAGRPATGIFVTPQAAQPAPVAPVAPFVACLPTVPQCVR